MQEARPGEYEFLMCQCTPVDDLIVETKATVYRTDPGACLPKYVEGLVSTMPELARDVMEFSIDLDSEMNFEAGQFVALRIPGVVGYRVYSMTNFERAARRLEFLVRRKPNGLFSAHLFNASCNGQRIQIFGPLGRAIFSPRDARNLLIIAGGSGIAGMMSILSRATEEGYFERHLGHVFFGVRAWADTFYLDQLSKMKENTARDRLKVTVALSDEEVPASANALYPALAFARGLVHEVAAQFMAGQYANTRAYVAGPPPAVDASLRFLLREAKLSPGEIRYDKFG